MLLIVVNKMYLLVCESVAYVDCQNLSTETEALRVDIRITWREEGS